MSYAEITTRDRNPVKRWLQRRRFADAVNALGDEGDIRQRTGFRILDFGAGNGELVRQLTETGPIAASVYEPTAWMMAEARENLSGCDSVAFVDNVGSIQSSEFDYIFCLEVFEHLPPEETSHAIMEINRLLKPNGTAIVGVPHELFLPALVKGIFRMVRRHGAFDTVPRNIIRAIMGHQQPARPISEIAPKIKYHPHHLGFDYRRLEQQLRAHFEIERKWFSPFPVLGILFNSEVYFRVRRINPVGTGISVKGRF